MVPISGSGDTPLPGSRFQGLGGKEPGGNYRMGLYIRMGFTPRALSALLAGRAGRSGCALHWVTVRESPAGRRSRVLSIIGEHSGDQACSADLCWSIRATAWYDPHATPGAGESDCSIQRTHRGPSTRSTPDPFAGWRTQTGARRRRPTPDNREPVRADCQNSCACHTP